jgi:predicted nucleotidyltransferase
MIRKLNDLPIFLPLDEIAELCCKHDVAELSVFGSALREDFGPESDIDFLVVFRSDDYGPWMGKLTRLEDDLSRLLGRKAEVVPKNDLKWVIRDRVLADCRVLYVDAQR